MNNIAHLRKTYVPKEKPNTEVPHPNLAPTMRSICQVEGAVCMEQVVVWHPRGGARLITTRWIDLAHRVLRQDEAVLVDEFPIIGGKS